MRPKIYFLGLACILLISCGKKAGSPTGPTDMPSNNPIISYFTATPSTIKLGEKSTLSWKVDNCTSVEIDVGIGKVTSTDSIEVSPSETTTYTLTAENTFYDEHTGILTMYSATNLCVIAVEN
jgi:hypothetical protein